ncbi:hypothetical protein F0562_007833 [Nyssa sinensis]|uniref:RING-type domain-containing protein n=1 Tax=Nyssa sinensis TaxID=561372 RepID=A0A5J5A9I8_9ASTE|nr:hypothetical protein F0562_007833 [Nyssa sinensis]
MPKAISITFLVNMLGHLKFMVMTALTRLVPVHVLTASIKESLPVLQYHDFLQNRFGKHEEEDENKACAVCLDSIEGSHEIRELCNCSHVFHRDCLDTWVDEGRVTCPFCRSMLLPPKGNLNQSSSCGSGGDGGAGADR